MENVDFIKLACADQRQTQKLGNLHQGTCNRIVDMAKLQPNLPIYAMVKSGVAARYGYTSWCGKMYRAEFNRLYVGKEKVWKWLEAMMDKEGFFESEAPEEMVEKAECMFSDNERKKLIAHWINTIQWETCILLYIVSPKDL